MGKQMKNFINPEKAVQDFQERFEEQVSSVRKKLEDEIKVREILKQTERFLKDHPKI